MEAVKVMCACSKDNLYYMQSSIDFMHAYSYTVYWIIFEVLNFMVFPKVEYLRKFGK